MDTVKLPARGWLCAGEATTLNFGIMVIATSITSPACFGSMLFVHRLFGMTFSRGHVFVQQSSFVHHE